MSSSTAYEVSTLPNGLTVATHTMTAVQSVALGFWARVGGRNEPEQLNGISHFLEHTLFKGTPSRSAQQITEEIESLGGDLNACTTAEYTCYNAVAAGRHLGRVLEVLTDMYQHAHLPGHEVERERKVIREEISMIRDQPDELVAEELSLLLWPNHPLGRPLTGSEETLAAITRDDLLAYRQKYYTAGQTIITAAGRVKHEELLGLLQEQIDEGALQTGDGQTAAPQSWSGYRAMSSQVPYRILGRDIEQTQLEIGFRAFSYHDDLRYAFRVLNTMLGGNMSSRLFQQLREKLGLCYSIDSGDSYFSDTGSIEIQAGLDGRQIVPALDAIFAEIDRFCQVDVTETALRNAQEYLVGQTELALEHSGYQMEHMGDSLLCYGRVDDPQAENERLREVTVADVHAVAQEVFQRSNLAIAVVCPEEEVSLIERELSRVTEQRLVA